jgi:2-keto-4-pentenoate hydratase/2-oxohepta-3-ene-1,7-dioic acid hydratase in catechol pathway
MKIARTLINGVPTFIGSADGNTFYVLEGESLQSLALNTQKPVDASRLLAPVAPPQIFAIGLNYRKHAEEFNNPIPEYPVVFMKNIMSVLDPGGSILIPGEAAATFVDYEVELAIVIRKRAKNVKVDEAFDYVLGYTIANDVTSRDWQKGPKGGGQWCRAKSFDTFCPLGPWIVTTDEIPDPDALTLESRVNGELRQKSNTGDMIFTIQELVSFVSQNTTLLPGAVILTGTPSGVGAGMDPKLRLAEGDEVRLTIEKIGELVNTVAAEPPQR